MAVTSIRFTGQEEKILNILTDYYHEDRSKILKQSLIEYYENLLDRKEIEDFEKKKKTSRYSV